MPHDHPPHHPHQGDLMTPRRDDSAHCGMDSRYGTCHRTHGHCSPHATFIGDRGFWFAWHAGQPLGYGHFRHGRFYSKTGGA